MTGGRTPHDKLVARWPSSPSTPSLTLITPIMLAVSLLSLVALVAATPAARDAPTTHIPLARRTHSAHSLARLPDIADFVRAKYGRPTLSSKRKRASTAAVAITNQVRGCLVAVLVLELTPAQDYDASYYASISVGTP